ncbi:hypothetical protein KMAL_26850 [Novacetimonas maltaceti]|uniref:Uncharacterized protein n=1 Tax=Novacetimonas maltaceti TaxID=1203393 RepID=A0A2S3VYI7_9PROT|nr:hypothetical protein KMAL_26850 [Novacetimonas maltaceti]
MVGDVALQQDMSLRLRPARAARHLVEELHRAFGRAQVAPAKAEVRIDDAHHRQVREVPPLCDDLRADHQVDLAPGDAFDRVRRGGRTVERVARHHKDARIGEGGARLLGNAFDAGADGGQAVFGVA